MHSYSQNNFSSSPSTTTSSLSASQVSKANVNDQQSPSNTLIDSSNTNETLAKTSEKLTSANLTKPSVSTPSSSSIKRNYSMKSSSTNASSASNNNQFPKVSTTTAPSHSAFSNTSKSNKNDLSSINKIKDYFKKQISNEITSETNDNNKLLPVTTSSSNKHLTTSINTSRYNSATNKKTSLILNTKRMTSLDTSACASIKTPSLTQEASKTSPAIASKLHVEDNQLLHNQSNQSEDAEIEEIINGCLNLTSQQSSVNNLKLIKSPTTPSNLNQHLNSSNSTNINEMASSHAANGNGNGVVNSSNNIANKTYSRSFKTEKFHVPVNVGVHRAPGISASVYATTTTTTTKANSSKSRLKDDVISSYGSGNALTSSSYIHHNYNQNGHLNVAKMNCSIINSNNGKKIVANDYTNTKLLDSSLNMNHSNKPIINGNPSGTNLDEQASTKLVDQMASFIEELKDFIDDKLIDTTSQLETTNRNVAGLFKGISYLCNEINKFKVQNDELKREVIFTRNCCLSLQQQYLLSNQHQNQQHQIRVKENKHLNLMLEQTTNTIKQEVILSHSEANTTTSKKHSVSSSFNYYDNLEDDTNDTNTTTTNMGQVEDINWPLTYQHTPNSQNDQNIKYCKSTTSQFEMENSKELLNGSGSGEGGVEYEEEDINKFRSSDDDEFDEEDDDGYDEEKNDKINYYGDCSAFNSITDFEANAYYNDTHHTNRRNHTQRINDKNAVIENGNENEHQQQHQHKNRRNRKDKNNNLRIEENNDHTHNDHENVNHHHHHHHHHNQLHSHPYDDDEYLEKLSSQSPSHSQSSNNNLQLLSSSSNIVQHLRSTIVPSYTNILTDFDNQYIWDYTDNHNILNK